MVEYSGPQYFSPVRDRLLANAPHEGEHVVIAGRGGARQQDSVEDVEAVAEQIEKFWLHGDDFCARRLVARGYVRHCAVSDTR